MKIYTVSNIIDEVTSFYVLKLRLEEIRNESQAFQRIRTSWHETLGSSKGGVRRRGAVFPIIESALIRTRSLTIGSIFQLEITIISVGKLSGRKMCPEWSCTRHSRNASLQHNQT
ncbi:hypothetical protein O6H91_18G025200 [Diphasiastrum complanatum]|uniref:Uncharacterized protein n=1 Tax=Diphasiastrum complanatum TaxID=34168 RepID=A0ACC2AYX9_DIPCM|nr:hypothetical protein O6H91_18G025200 [Diphasiastrum complanatum]